MRAIVVGYACNNACSFCSQGALRRTRPAVESGDVVRALEAVAPGETVAFVGGEPTLFPELPQWIRAATARSAGRVILQTNGRRLAYRAFAHELAEASSVLRLDVSLHGSNAAMHDWHTGTPGSFAQTVQGLRNARAERIAAGVTTVVTRSNYRHLGDIVRVAHAAGANAVHVVAVEPFGAAIRRRSVLVPPPEMVAPHLHRAQADAGRLGIRFEVGARTSGDLFAGLGDVEAPDPAADRVEVSDTP
jgi:MoaA/NifB/PqqE/SkfB family radical SAM enzyme